MLLNDRGQHRPSNGAAPEAKVRLELTYPSLQTKCRNLSGHLATKRLATSGAFSLLPENARISCLIRLAVVVNNR